MSTHILVVEDEEALSVLLKYNLESEGYVVEVVGRGDEAELVIFETQPDLILLDWMLPGISGIELCRRLRRKPETEKTPVVMLTARGEESERIRGLETGADDYVVKPFSVPELMARVRSLLRRTNPNAVSQTLHGAGITLDRVVHRVHLDGEEIDLGPTEYRLLEFLMQNPGQVFSRAQLLDGVWGREIYVHERTVDVHVGRLRKAITRSSTVNPIRTVRGAGYAFDEKL